MKTSKKGLSDQIKKANVGDEKSKTNAQNEENPAAENLLSKQN